MRLVCEWCMKKLLSAFMPTLLVGAVFSAISYDIARRNCIQSEHHMTLLVRFIFSTDIMYKQATAGGIHVAINGDVAASPLISVRESVVVSWQHDGKWRPIVGI